jgi:hypothetical protein
MRGCFAAVMSILFVILGVPYVLDPAVAQVPYVPQAPVPQQAPQAAPRQQPAPVDQQRSLEYAFRPDLSNPEYGECLNLERHWKTLWNSYTQSYQQAAMMHPSDPRYAQMASYVNSLRQQLDAAWNNFSSRCVYFPRSRP